MPIFDYFLRMNSPRGKDVYIFFEMYQQSASPESFTQKNSAVSSCVPAVSCGFCIFKLRTQRWKNLSVNLQKTAFNHVFRDFPGALAAEISPSDSGGMGSTPG